MITCRILRIVAAAIALLLMTSNLSAPAQEQPAQRTEPEQRGAQPERRPRSGRPRGPVVVSPEVKSDRTVVFRVLAPTAVEVSLSGGDLPGLSQEQRRLTKGENGVWELTTGPVNAGAYRYTFTVDGLGVVDPRNPSVSESNNTVWSVVYVPGSDYSDTADVPHGAVAEVHYHSGVLGRARRMHVYTPPGYQARDEKYPVFYLLHGASDSDDSWTSVGRANFILDNLIAAGKAKPMIVVMPAGHTGPFSFGGGPRPAGDRRPSLGNGGFEEEFAKDIRPYVEKHYRVLTDRENRAIAGLSMGGAQTLTVALANLKDYGYVGVFSSGLLFGNSEAWEKERKEVLEDKAAKDGLKLFWFATGSEDFLVARTRETVETFKRHGFEPVYKETGGGHTWINWREYLNEFAPMLFK